MNLFCCHPVTYHYTHFGNVTGGRTLGSALLRPALVRRPRLLLLLLKLLLLELELQDLLLQRQLLRCELRRLLPLLHWRNSAEPFCRHLAHGVREPTCNTPLLLLWLLLGEPIRACVRHRVLKRGTERRASGPGSGRWYGPTVGS